MHEMMHCSAKKSEGEPSNPTSSPRTRLPHRALHLLCMALLFTASLRPSVAMAQEDEEVTSSDGEEEATSDDGGGEETEEEVESEDYEEIDALEKLEEEALEVELLDSENWNPELLAPYQGMLADVRREAGVIHELHGLPRAAIKGAALCEHPAVKSRFEQTEVLGKQVPIQEPELRAYLDFFDGRGKPTLVRWLRRMGYYEEMILDVLREEGLPEDLIYVAMIESGFSPTARSHASAVGVWQFIATTGEEMGLRIDRHVDERQDPVKATRAAAKYLKLLHNRYDSWPLALAAYNGGPGLVNKEMDRYNSNDYWFIARQRGMYDETRRYVPKVIAVSMMAKNPDIFGLEGLIAHEPARFDVVEVENPTRLSTIASAISTDVEELRKLNPELRAAATPPMDGGEFYMLRIPAGSAKAFVKHFDKVAPSREGEDYFLHEARFGESLNLLAKHYGVKKRVLRAVNGLGKRDRVRDGELLVIPGKKEAHSAAASSNKELVLVPSASFDYGDTRVHYIYRANAGDRPRDIARALRLNAADIAIWNAVEPDAKLRDGMYLQLYLDPAVEVESLAIQKADNYQVVAYGSEEYKKLYIAKRATERKKGSGRRYHKVRAGQSLWTIARKYRTTVKQIKRLNPKLRRDNTLQPGEKVRVR